MNRRVAVRGIVLHDGKLLCVRLKKYDGRATDGADDYWCTPGGGVDIGEPLLPALRREIVEELGVEPTIGNLLYIQQFVHGNTEQLEFFFHVTNAEDYLHIDLAQTTHGAIEIETVDFIDPSQVRLLPTFLTNESLAEQTTPGAAPKFFNNINNHG